GGDGAEEVRQGSLRVGSAAPVQEMGNIYWRDIPAGTRVELVGHSYVVTLGNGERKGAYWEGREAREAQRSLDKWVRHGVRERTAAREGVTRVVATGVRTTDTGASYRGTLGVDVDVVVTLADGRTLTGEVTLL